MPAIIWFLGYNRLPQAHTLAEQLVGQRLGVDPSTLARWERGEREPTGVLLGRVERFVDAEEAADLEARRVG